MLRKLPFWSRSFRQVGVHLCASSPVPKTEFWWYVSGYGYLQVLTSFSEGPWPVSFVGQVGDQQYSYSPRGDFVLFLNGLPFLVIEYSSDRREESDRNRLLLQTGLYVRTMNATKGGSQLAFQSFMMMVVYLTGQAVAERYFVYQPEWNQSKVRIMSCCGSLWLMVLYIQVEYVKDSFDLQTPVEAFKFFFELHNLLSALPFDTELPRIVTHLSSLREQVHNAGLRGFTTAKKDNKRKRDDPEPSGPPPGDNTHGFGNHSTIQRLSDAGYKVLPEQEAPGWTLLNPVRSSSVCSDHRR